MDMMEMFRIITEAGLSPDQFYLLYCMSENVASVSINIPMNLRMLILQEWVKDETGYTIQPKGHTLLQQVSSFFTVQKKKTSNQVLGTDYDVNIDAYLMLFPKEKLPSGKPARSDRGNVETAFKWFFETRKYSWDTILKATAKYVDEYERKTPRYMYMQTAQYLIRKQAQDKTWGSELANICAALESGSDQSPRENHFSEKVV